MTTTDTATAVETLDYRKVSDLKFNPDNPRKTFDQALIRELAASIEAEGLLQPMRVRADGTIIAGERRKRAIDLLIKEKRVPASFEASCIILSGTSADEDQMAALIENLQRVDLTPLEEAKGYYALLGLDVRQADIAKRVGRSSAHVSKRLSLLTLEDPVQEALTSGKITLEKALGLTGIKDPKKQVALVGKDDYAVADAIRKQATTEALAKVRTELEGLGLDVFGDKMKAPPEGTDWQQVGESMRHSAFKGSAPKGATAVSITAYSADQVVMRWYKLITLPKGTVADDPKAAEAKAKAAREKADAKLKAEHEAKLAKLGAAVSSVNKAGAVSVLLRAMLAYVNDTTHIGVALGLTPETLTRSWDVEKEYLSYDAAVTAYAEMSEINMIRVLLIDAATDYDSKAAVLAFLGLAEDF